MGFDLSAMLKDVSNLDTSRDQIEYIDIDLIDQDPNNFYQLSRVDELAANIELLGLQQPIRVRDNPNQPGRVIIVSGHRRRAALQLLVDEGKERFREVPCIREKEAGSAALQELKLIYANADTRTMTSAEISKQVERVEALLYQLKEEGMEFPGRMRDHVAEACKVSKSKLARLKVIRERLQPGWQKLYDADKINESAAYALAQLEPVYQKAIFDSTVGNMRRVYEGYVRNCAKSFTELEQLQCLHTDCESVPCEHKEGKIQHIVQKTENYVTTSCGRCCADCMDLVTCKDACPKMADRVRAAKDQRKFQRQQDRKAKEERDRPHVEVLSRIWKRFGEARAAAGLSVEEYQNAVDLFHSKADDESYPKMEQGEGVTVYTQLPYCYGMGYGTAERLVKAADALGCSLDYLFCRTDKPNGDTSPLEGCLPLEWLSGQKHPQKAGQQAVAKFRVDAKDTPRRMIAEWNGSRWRFPNGGATIDAECVAWFPIPGEEEGN